MLLPMMSAVFAMMLPLNPGADQTVLTQLFKAGVETSFEGRPPERNGSTHLWMGSECVSILGVREPSGDRAAYRILWSEAALLTTSDDSVVGVKGLTPPREAPLEAATLFRFKDSQTAQTAREAMLRLKTACTPQR